MFRRLATNIPNGADLLFRQHPSVLSTLLEVAWQFRAHNPAEPPGYPGRRSNISQLPGFWLNPLRAAAGIAPPHGAPGLAPSWEHLIYAYMIENTRIYEIFRRVLHEILHGEKLAAPTPAAQHWLRNTEELFYRQPPAFSIISTVSDIRPDMRSTRRNAYHRMFGMDLNHGGDDNRPHPYLKADSANNEFVPAFEDFLREAWVAISNVNNAVGANPTDRDKIGFFANKLQEMLLARRQHGNLSREEFAFVSMMAWFHLTVEFDSPIVADLRASALSPEERLFQIAQRVGLPAHGLSRSYFAIADLISTVLVSIEAGTLNALPASPAPPFSPAMQTALNTIITHWSVITGRDMKANPVATQAWKNGAPSAPHVPQRGVTPREPVTTETARF